MTVDAPETVEVETPPPGDEEPKLSLEEQYEKAAEAAGVELPGDGEDEPAEAGDEGDEPTVETPEGAEAPEGGEDEEPGAEVPAYVLPDDPDERATALAGIKNHPDIQKWQSDATAKAANTAATRVRGEERERATNELNELLARGDPRARRAMKTAEDEKSQELVSLGRAANTLYDATVDLLGDTYGLDKTELKSTTAVPELIAKVLETLDKKRDTEFDAKVQAGIRALRDKERGGRPSPSRDAAPRNERPPAAKGGSLGDYYEEAVRQAERG
ncbi:hypothetical protein CMI37_06855 [Candidatus Pacearchaeota archaeon]|nr:hypothetical protein [Candidatus Pacearchaeota archaeon]